MSYRNPCLARMGWPQVRILSGVLAIAVGAVSGPRAAYAVSAAALQAHAGINEYAGPATCVECHETQAEGMFGSVHYQETGPTPNVTNIPGTSGKGELGFNTYCGAIVSSRRVACWTCHVSYGRVPRPTMTSDQLHNIDCLVCHQDAYKRKVGAPTELLSFTDYAGVSRTWRLPVEDAGDFTVVPDEANMTLSIVEAARTVHPPTRSSCLRCHAFAAGSDNGKRGDLSTVSANPPVTSDFHLSPAGADLTCQACHRASNHHLLGRGLDLRANDRPEPLECTLCHSASPHDDSKLNRHTNRVACQTCHIPTYAKDASTETARDWRYPFWSASLFGGQGGFKPEEIRGANLTPTYEWYDGTSQVYALGQIAPMNDQGQYEMAFPNGGVRSSGAKIYPMKEHVSNSARHDATGRLIPHSTFTFFVTGDFNRAVEDGMQWSELTGGWTLVNVHTYQTINHGVEPHDNALKCGQCHGSLSGGPVRMDLKGRLGYALKAPQDHVCTQCHAAKPYESFTSVHEKHVNGKRYDCAWCHAFARPERALRAAPLPPTVAVDFDADGDVDLADFAHLQACFNGPNRPFAGWECRDADADRDGDADLADFAILQSCFNGPNRQPACG